MDLTQEVKKPPTMQRFREYLGRKLSFNRIVWLFFYVNMLNYIERFIISGSAVEIEDFVEQSVHGSKDTFLGLLQSAFILGFSIACIVFGYVVKSDSPFSIVCIGLLVWTIASFASGLAFNYWVLLFARLFSGVGEAAFQIVVPTFIDDFSPKDHVGTSMSRLYMAIPVGTAVGYALSGYVAEHFSWRIMFLVTAPLMIPFIVVLHYFPVSVLSEAQIMNQDFGAEEPSASASQQNDFTPAKDSSLPANQKPLSESETAKLCESQSPARRSGGTNRPGLTQGQRNFFSFRAAHNSQFIVDGIFAVRLNGNHNTGKVRRHHGFVTHRSGFDTLSKNIAALHRIALMNTHTHMAAHSAVQTVRTDTGGNKRAVLCADCL